MGTSNFKGFLNKVTSKIKTKEAHSMIRKELSNHLHTLSKSFQLNGSSKEEAEESAIQEMGNPYTLGNNLNKIHKPKMDWPLIILFLTLAAISFLPIINGVPDFPISSSFLIGRQILGYIIAILIICSCLFFDYRKLFSRWKLFYGIGLIFHLYCGLFGLNVGGAKNWITIFGFGLDVPIVTLFLFFLAWVGIISNITMFNSWIKQIGLSILFWTPILLYLIVPSFVVSIIYIVCILVMFIFSHVRKKLAIRLIGINMVLGLFLIVFMITTYGTESLNRLRAFINPNIDPFGDGYWYILLKEILEQAGWFGNGLDHIPSLPSIHTDFVFTFLVATLGWSFGIILCILLLAFILRISFNAFKTKDHYGRLLVLGGATLFIVPTCWNVLMGLGFLPILGVFLPFISYGNTVLVVYAAILGLVLSVYRRKDIVESVVNR